MSEQSQKIVTLQSELKKAQKMLKEVPKKDQVSDFFIILTRIYIYLGTLFTNGMMLTEILSQYDVQKLIKNVFALFKRERLLPNFMINKKIKCQTLMCSNVGQQCH